MGAKGNGGPGHWLLGWAGLAGTGTGWDGFASVWHLAGQQCTSDVQWATALQALVTAWYRCSCHEYLNGGHAMPFKTGTSTSAMSPLRSPGTPSHTRPGDRGLGDCGQASHAAAL
jgi:hypothetical protein